MHLYLTENDILSNIPTKEVKRKWIKETDKGVKLEKFKLKVNRCAYMKLIHLNKSYSEFTCF